MNYILPLDITNNCIFPLGLLNFVICRLRGPQRALRPCWVKGCLSEEQRTGDLLNRSNSDREYKPYEICSLHKTCVLSWCCHSLCIALHHKRASVYGTQQTISWPMSAEGRNRASWRAGDCVLKRINRWKGADGLWLLTMLLIWKANGLRLASLLAAERLE